MEISFEIQVASRGWHKYGKTVWTNLKIGELLQAKREANLVALNIDPYSIARMLKRRDKLVPIVVGHIPKEISRFVWFFLGYGGEVKGKVYSQKCQASPIPNGDLEIILIARLSITDKKKKILEHLKTLIEKNYVLQEMDNSKKMNADKEEEEEEHQEEDVVILEDDKTDEEDDSDK